MPRLTRRLAARLIALAAIGLASFSLTEVPSRALQPSAGGGGTNAPQHVEKPYVILISFDAFRPDYFDRYDVPNFRRVLRQGTRARAMIPVFPSMTFPNHYSLVTGLYPERHGIVANSFYDPERKASYGLRDRAAVEDGTWYRGEPIWVTAEKQGMVAACFFFPGSEAAIGGVRPTFWNKYDGTIPNTTRVKAVIDWLRLPAARRPHVITLYFSDLDVTGHQVPLDSPQVAAAVQSLDSALGELLAGIETLTIRDQVYLVLTSDHGMMETSIPQTTLLSSLVEPERLEAAFGGPVATLHVKGGAEEARAVRDQINSRLRHGRAYLREETPERFRFRADPRIGDVVIVMDESWTLATSAFSRARPHLRWGSHGWDPAYRTMHAIFAISGPGIKGNAVIPEVRNVDVYPLMTELLGLAPAQGIDGRPGHILGQLRAAVGW
jgi:predicted AlkP superfamily pyrophosphatase or phosphodiesterase